MRFGADYEKVNLAFGMTHLVKFDFTSIGVGKSRLVGQAPQANLAAVQAKHPPITRMSGAWVVAADTED